jgi:UrcA family protein
MTYLARLAAALLAAAVPASAIAQSPAFQPDAFQISVAAGDLNLASKSGQARLAGRIDAAADRVCGYNGVVALRTQLTAEACRAEFTKVARQQLGATGNSGTLAAAGR